MNEVFYLFKKQFETEQFPGLLDLQEFYDLFFGYENSFFFCFLGEVIVSSANPLLNRLIKQARRREFLLEKEKISVHKPKIYDVQMVWKKRIHCKVVP